MLNSDAWKRHFESGLDTQAYLATGTDQQRGAWAKHADALSLTDDQASVLAAFKRDMNILVLSGLWCGDCVRQGPMLVRLAEQAGVGTGGGDGGAGGGARVRLRWLDRDAAPELQDLIQINAGKRVPVAMFLSEDFHLVSWAGDKLLHRYRQMAAEQLGSGAQCPLPSAAADSAELAAELSDWMDEFERVHLLLRLSGRLRKLHGD